MLRRMLFALLAVALGAALTPPAPAQPAADAVLRVGMVKSFFNDVPKELIDLVTEPFGEVMKQTTGRNGKLVMGEGALDVAAHLNDGKLNLGVFHGHELAWAQKKYPKLTPLMIVVNDHHDVRAYIIVHKDNPAKTLTELRGKAFDIPKMTKEHCRIYLQKHCTDNAESDPRKFFATTQNSETAYRAMDDVARGKVDAAVVDRITLEFYKEIKGATFRNNLRILQQSEPAFPPPAIVYKEGALDAATLKAIREGLIGSNKNPLANQLNQVWGIRGYEAIPANYSKSLADVLKAYPLREATKITMR